MYDATNKYWKLEGDLLVTGGISMFSSDSAFTPSTIMDAIATDGVNLKVVDGVLTYVGDSGGLSEVYWDDVIGRPTLLSSFIDDVVQGNYLPLSGGKVTGYIDYNTDRTIGSSLIGVPCAGTIHYESSMVTEGSLNQKKTFIGTARNNTYSSWWNLISVRHVNGSSSDSDKYGMYIVSPMTDSGDLSWNKQTGYGWQGERVILDSYNWSQYVTAVSTASEYSYGLKVVDSRYTNTCEPSGKVSWNLKVQNVIGVSTSNSTYAGLLDLSAWYDWSAGLLYQLAFLGTTERIMFRTGNNGTFGSWKSFLYADSSGKVDINGPFLMNGMDGSVKIYSQTNGQYGNENVCIQTSIDGEDPQTSSYPTITSVSGRCNLLLQPRGGTVYVGYNLTTWHTQSDEKLKINGSMYAASDILAGGGITMYSDIRKKTKLQDVELSLQQVADAPLIEHYYNSDANKTTHVGSIAQYWASLNDWFCKLDNEGYYTMEIQNAALASAISIARELQRYESKTDKKIRLLKKRIGELEDEIEKLKTA